jgi:hypothetical protein
MDTPRNSFEVFKAMDKDEVWRDLRHKHRRGMHMVLGDWL